MNKKTTYEFGDWIITLESWFDTNKLSAFATLKKYAHFATYDNLPWIDELCLENNIPVIINEFGDENFDIHYIYLEPDDSSKYFIDFTSEFFLLNHIVKEIIEESNIDFLPKDILLPYKLECGLSIAKSIEVVVVKEIKRKTQYQFISTKKRGAMQTAWAMMVKNRDKKCTQCQSEYDLHAHHIKSYKEFVELRFDVNNGITLCGKCHRKFHKKNK